MKQKQVKSELSNRVGDLLTRNQHNWIHWLNTNRNDLQTFKHSQANTKKAVATPKEASPNSRIASHNNNQSWENIYVFLIPNLKSIWLSWVLSPMSVNFDWLSNFKATVKSWKHFIRPLFENIPTFLFVYLRQVKREGHKGVSWWLGIAFLFTG